MLDHRSPHGPIRGRLGTGRKGAPHPYRRPGRDPMRDWTGFLQTLRATFAQGDPHALTRAWDEGRTHPRLGPLIRMVERFYPVGHVLFLAAELDRRIALYGLSEASHWLLDTWAGGWKAQVPSSTATVLASQPTLLYGNHPSLLTPFLVAANTHRADLKVISASFLERFLPNYAPYAIPVALPTSNWSEQFRRGGFSRLLMAMLMHYLQPELPRESAKEVNRQAIAEAANYIRAGSAILVAPSGWSVHRWPWHPGIERILQSLAAQPGEKPDYLVPFREENSSDARMRAVFGRLPEAEAFLPPSCGNPVRTTHALFGTRPLSPGRIENRSPPADRLR